jgi:6-pyruvoyltetrahydropterin/6-carboxytetrahydropterin synthase
MSQIQIRREYTFDSAHYLPRVPDGHKCKRLHGHTYTLIPTVSGIVDEDSGMILDFADLDVLVKRAIVDRVDHRCLNDLYENPTAENMVGAMALDLIKVLPVGMRLVSLELREGLKNAALYVV